MSNQDWLITFASDYLSELDEVSLEIAKATIIAKIAEAERLARIDELENLQEWINQGLAESHKITRLAALKEETHD